MFYKSFVQVIILTFYKTFLFSKAMASLNTTVLDKFISEPYVKKTAAV